MKALASLACLVAFLVALSGSPSIAGENRCEYDGATGTVTLRAFDREVIFLRRSGTSQDPGDIIQYGTPMVDWRNCDGATVRNTDQVVFVDESERGHGVLGIQHSHGLFVPGRTEEPKGSSEIEFQLDMRGESSFRPGVSIFGSDDSETIIGGARGLKVNGDNDLDVRIRGLVGGYSVSPGRGEDSVLLDGRQGTGRFDPDDRHRHFAFGGPGNDLIIGGPSADTLWGVSGNDRILARRGADDLRGGGGRDRIHAGGGPDAVRGQGDDDHLEGSLGNDSLQGQNGNDHLDGDAGNDECRGGPGKDSKEDCER